MKSALSAIMTAAVLSLAACQGTPAPSSSCDAGQTVIGIHDPANGC